MSQKKKRRRKWQKKNKVVTSHQSAEKKKARTDYWINQSIDQSKRQLIRNYKLKNHPFKTEYFSEKITSVPMAVCVANQDKKTFRVKAVADSEERKSNSLVCWLENGWKLYRGRHILFRDEVPIRADTVESRPCPWCRFHANSDNRSQHWWPITWKNGKKRKFFEKKRKNWKKKNQEYKLFKLTFLYHSLWSIIHF